MNETLRRNTEQHKKANLVAKLAIASDGWLSKAQIEEIVNSLDLSKSYSVEFTTDPEVFKRMITLEHIVIDDKKIGTNITKEDVDAVFFTNKASESVKLYENIPGYNKSEWVCALYDNDLAFGINYCYMLNEDSRVVTKEQNSIIGNFPLTANVVFLKKSLKYIHYGDLYKDETVYTISGYMGLENMNESFIQSPEILFILNNFNI